MANKNNKQVEVKNKKAVSLQVMRGRVVAAKATQTVSVLVEREKIHPLYHKSYKRSKKYLVHTLTQLSEGDLVEFIKVRPISKNKHWQIRKVVGKDIEAIVSQQLKEGAAEAIAEVMPEKDIEPEEQIKSEEKNISESEIKPKAKRQKKEENL